MYALNRVTLVGRIGQDPEIRHLENNVVVGRFSIAVTQNGIEIKKETGKKDAPTEWHDIVVWRRLAERAKAMNSKKESLVYIEGKLTSRKWEDKDGNSIVKLVEIVARDFRAFETYPYWRR